MEKTKKNSDRKRKKKTENTNSFPRRTSKKRQLVLDTQKTFSKVARGDKAAQDHNIRGRKKERNCHNDLRAYFSTT